MEPTAKPLERLRAGDAVKHDGVVWFVKERTVYKESKDYQEIQWTLLSKERGEYYLVRSEEKTPAGFEYVWVFTKQIQLSGIEFSPFGDNWEYFDELSFVTSPPQKIRFNNLIFNFDSEISGKARDDEGLTVTKLTWDYYDETKTRNLAIEVWKEDDRDYPEAYEGIVVEPYKFAILPANQAAQLRAKFKKWYVPALVYGAILFFAFLIGMPFDMCLALSAPIFAFYMTRYMFGKMRWLDIASLLVWVAMSVLMIATNFSFSYWIVAAYGIGISTIIARMTASAFSESGQGYCGLISFTGLLPAIWAYSFWVYFRFAPGPHTLSQLFATSILPLFAAVACYALNLLLDRMYYNAA